MNGGHVRDRDVEPSSLWPAPQEPAGTSVDVVAVLPSREVVAAIPSAPRE